MKRALGKGKPSNATDKLKASKKDVRFSSSAQISVNSGKGGINGFGSDEGAEQQEAGRVEADGEAGVGDREQEDRASAI